MKKLIIIWVHVLLTYFANGQIIQNTIWEHFDTTSTFEHYVRFETDTIKYSLDGINYSEFATFQENGNNFKVVDIPLFFCSAITPDSGNYTFYIQNDSLFFDLIQDTCFARTTFFDLEFWVRNQTSALNEFHTEKIKLYPNPARNVVTIEVNSSEINSVVLIYNQLGELVVNNKITQHIEKYNISQLSTGIYYLQIQDLGKGVKFMKE